MTTGNTILSVSKAMELLQILSKAGSSLSLKELGERSGYPKSTVFGLLNTMRDYDVVTQTAEGKYTLGIRLFEYGCQVSQSWDISTIVHPFMQELLRKTGSSVTLSTWDTNSVITIDQMEAQDKLRVIYSTGSRLPIHCTSAGKAFLSQMSFSDVKRLLSQDRLIPYTPHTITDVETFLAELETWKKAGYAIENGEYVIGLRAISSPIFSHDKKVQYTIGVMGMFRSIHSEEFDAAIKAVKEVSRQISAALGYQGN